MIRGTVTAVTRYLAGSAVAATLTAGDGQIVVYDASDFGDSGTCAVSGAEVAYESVLWADEYDSGVTQDTLVLVDTSPVDAAVGVRVDVRPDQVEFRAAVLVGGSSTPATATVAHSLIDAGTLPVQSGGLSVPVWLSDDDVPQVVDVVGRQPSRDLAFAKDSSLPSAAVDQDDWTAQRLAVSLLNQLGSHDDLRLVGPDIRSSTSANAPRFTSTGFDYPGPDGPLISFPDVDTPQAVVTAVLRALGLDVSGAAFIRALLQVGAGAAVDLATAAPDPPTAPGVSVGWPSIDFPDLVDEPGWGPVGLCRVTDACLTLAALVGAPGYSIYTLSDDGTITEGTYVDGPDVDTWQGLTRLGTSTWVAYVSLSTGGLMLQEWPDAGGSGDPIPIPVSANPWSATLGTDGTHLLVAYVDDGPAVHVGAFSTSGVAVTSATLPTVPGTDYAIRLVGVQRGNFDWGERAWVIWTALSPSNEILVDFDSDPSGWTHTSTFPPAGGPWQWGADWDSVNSRFVGLTYHGHGTVWSYGDSSLDSVAQPFYFSYTWYGSGGAYESQMSPLQKVRWLRRSQVMVTAGDSLPGSFGGADPDSIRAYAGDAGSPPNRTQMHLLGASSTGSATFSGDHYDATAANPPSSNDFPGTGDPPGKLTVGAVDALVPDGPAPATWSGDVIDYVQGLIAAGGGGGGGGVGGGVAIDCGGSAAGGSVAIDCGGSS